MAIATPIPFLRARFCDRCNNPLAGGKVYTYEPNSLTPKVTYTAPISGTPNTNPIILDAAGEANIYLAGRYRIIVQDSKGVVVNDNDDVGSWYSDSLESQFQSINEYLDTTGAAIAAAAQAQVDASLVNPQSAINIAAAAGAGANGWTALVVQDSSGLTQEAFNRKAVTEVESVADLLSISPLKNKTIKVKGYWAGSEKGGGTFVWRSGVSKARHNGGTIISSTVPWNGTRAQWAYFNGTTTGDLSLSLGVASSDPMWPSTLPTTPFIAQGADNNPTNVRTRFPVLAGFVAGTNETDVSGYGCWVREDNNISVCNFGAVGDAQFEIDGTDDSYAFLAAIKALPKRNAVLNIEPYIYTHGNGDTRIILFYLKGYRRLTINGAGATIQSHSANHALVANSFFWYYLSKDVTVNGLAIDGRLDVRTPVNSDGTAYNRQYGHFVGQGCKNITFNQCTANRCMMDGFMIGGNPLYDDPITYSAAENITLNQCVSEYNLRQGLSIVRNSVAQINGGSFSYTGTLKGVPPSAGIDIEADFSTNLDLASKYVTIDGVSAVGNKGAGVWFSVAAKSCKLTNSRIADNGAYGVAASPLSTNNVIENNTLIANGATNSAEGCDFYALGYDNVYKHNKVFSTKRAIINPNSYAGRNIFDSNTFTNQGDVARAGAIYIEGAKQYTNNHHVNLQALSGYQDAVIIDDPACVVTGNTGENSNAANTASFMQVINALRFSDNKSVGYFKRSGVQMRTGSGTVSFIGNNLEDYDPKSTQGLSSTIDGIRYPPILHNGLRIGNATSVPTAGNWKLGDILFNNSPTRQTADADASFAYWLCVRSGSYAAISTTASANNGDAFITVASTAGISVGSFLTVTVATINNAEVLKIDGNMVYLATTAKATVTDAAVTTSAPLWERKGFAARKGTTASRPAMAADAVGVMYFDTNITAAGKPIWWTGTQWVDATGTVV